MSLSYVQLFVTPRAVAHLAPSSAHGRSPGSLLEWVAIPFSKGSCWPRDRTRVSCIVVRNIITAANKSDKSALLHSTYDLNGESSHVGSTIMKEVQGINSHRCHLKTWTCFGITVGCCVGWLKCWPTCSLGHWIFPELWFWVRVERVLPRLWQKRGSDWRSVDDRNQETWQNATRFKGAERRYPRTLTPLILLKTQLVKRKQQPREAKKSQENLAFSTPFQYVFASDLPPDDPVVFGEHPLREILQADS